MGLIINLIGLSLVVLIGWRSYRLGNQHPLNWRVWVSLLLLFHGLLQLLRLHLMRDELLLNQESLITPCLWVIIACAILLGTLLLIDHLQSERERNRDKLWALLALIGLPLTLITLLYDLNVDLDLRSTQRVEVTVSQKTSIRPKNRTQCFIRLRLLNRQQSTEPLSHRYRVSCGTYHRFETGQSLILMRHPGILGMAWFEPDELMIMVSDQGRFNRGFSYANPRPLNEAAVRTAARSISSDPPVPTLE